MSDTSRAEPAPAVADRGEAYRWLLAMGLLSLPLLVMVVALDGLRDTYPTYHGADEAEFHLPVIVEFTRTFPRAAIDDYYLATTPLFHLVAAAVGAVLSDALPVLRLINVIATWLFAGTVFLTASRILGTDYWTAVLLALAVSLAPYIFGTAFILLTDNLAMLLAMAALFFALRHLEGRDSDALVLAALFAAGAILTRQLYLWLLPVMLAAWALGQGRGSGRNPAGILALLALTVAPYGLLVVLWGGLNPPRFQSFHQWNPRAVGFLVACIGAYGGPFLAAAMRAPGWWRAFGPIRFALVLAVATVATLLAAPLHYVGADPSCAPNDATCYPTDGYLWKLSAMVPTVAGSSLLFWVLVPLGYATLLYACRPAPRSREAPGAAPRPSFVPALLAALDRRAAMALVVFVTYAALSTANASPFQKYYDFVALLVSVLIVFRAGHYRAPAARLVLAGYCLLFAAYAARPFLA